MAINRRHPPARRAAIAWLVLLVAICAVLVPFRTDIAPGTAALMLLVAPLTAAFGGLRLAAFASIVSALAFNFFFTRPYDSLRIESSTSVAAFVVYLALALSASILIARLRAAAVHSEERAREEALLRSLTVVLLRQSTWMQSTLDEALELLVTQLELDGASLFVTMPEGESYTSRIPNGAGSPAGADSPPSAPSFTQSVRSSTQTYGSLSLTPDSETARRISPIVANLVALACQRAHLDRETSQRELLEQTDRHRTALMQSVSHDLRTPLTSIRLMASAIPEVGQLTSQQQSMLDDIDREADRLAALVEQVLDLTRIDSGALQLHRTTVGIDDVITAAVAAVTSPPRTGVVNVTVEPELPAVNVDETLMRQVIINLLDNALFHGGSPVELEVRARHDRLEIAVCDHGAGIRQADRHRIFDAGFAMSHATSQHRSHGVGLAVADGFVRAHKGHIRVEATPGGGATFVVSLPAGHVTTSSKPADARSEAPS